MYNDFEETTGTYPVYLENGIQDYTEYEDNEEDDLLSLGNDEDEEEIYIL